MRHLMISSYIKGIFHVDTYDMYTFGYSRIQLTLNNAGLNCAGPLIHIFLSVNTENVFALYYDILITFYFLFLVRMQYIIHMT